MRRSWRRRTERASHADDWLMTYADMITLLLCFFAVMLSVSIPKKDAPPHVQSPPPVEQTVKEQAVSAPVQPPDPFTGNLPFHDISQEDMPPENVVEQAPAPVAEPAPALPVAEPPSAPVESKVVEAAPPTPPATLPEIVDHLKTQGNADIEQKGDRITTMQISSAAFFDSGSATLSNSGKAILQAVAVNLKSEKFKDYQVTVEGHTDDQPIKTLQFPSNWELSTARASAVVHFFLDQGVPARKLRAAGYADTFPVAPNRDANGNPVPANEARNRRVIIQLEKIEKTE